jgi:predicted metal-dependent phosphoesterase TrpH
LKAQVKTLTDLMLSRNDNKKPGGVSGKWAQFDEVIKWIHAAGGVAVLAHPLRYRMTNTKIQRSLIIPTMVI